MNNYIKCSYTGERNIRDVDSLPQLPARQRRPRLYAVDDSDGQQDIRSFDSWVWFFDSGNELEAKAALAIAEQKAAMLKLRLNGRETKSVSVSIYERVPWIDLPVIGEPMKDQATQQALFELDRPMNDEGGEVA